MRQSSWNDVANIEMYMVDASNIDNGDVLAGMVKEMVTIKYRLW
jgi:hypothetical protein